MGYRSARPNGSPASAAKYVLESEFELEFDDPSLGRCTVADVVGEPNRYVGETLADPLEGVSYGRNKAKVLAQDNRCLMIHSFAHGGINYQLAGQGVRLEDFRSYKPDHKYFYIPNRMAWPAESVNATIPPVQLFDRDGEPVLDAKGKPVHIKPTQHLDRYQSVEALSWAPGSPAGDRR